MSTLVRQFVLAGTAEEVPFARRQVVDQAGKWSVEMDDETADTVRLVASELIANATIHGAGPVTVTLGYEPGRLVIDVKDGNSTAPQASCANADDESGRGLALVSFLASRYGWEPAGQGKRVWAEIALPVTAPAARAAVLRRLFTLRSKRGFLAEPQSLARAVA